MTSLLRKKRQITQPNTWAETRTNSVGRRAAILIAAVVLIADGRSIATGGELKWQSPTNGASASKPVARGEWTQAGAVSKPTPTSRASAKSATSSSVSTARSNMKTSPTAVTRNALRRDDRDVARSLPSHNVVRVAHEEPAQLRGPRFGGETATTMPEIPEEGARPMRSVLVNRSASGAGAAESTGPVLRESRRREIGRRHGADHDPFDETPRNAQVLPGAPSEPRAFDDPLDDPARDAGRDPFEPTDASPTESEITPFVDPNEAPPAEAEAAPFADPNDASRDQLDIESLRPDNAMDDDVFQDERQRTEQDCAEKIRRLKAHTLDPWRDTLIAGWEDRTGDEIRELLRVGVEGDEGSDFPFECKLVGEQYEQRDWAGVTYMWKASALCHNPLYFEDVQLERYGHSWGPFAQPLISGAHFFASVPILPYKMGLQMPNECVYSLGYYRPGNCAPYLIDPVPFTWRAAVLQAGATVGVAAVIP